MANDTYITRTFSLVRGEEERRFRVYIEKDTSGMLPLQKYRDFAVYDIDKKLYPFIGLLEREDNSNFYDIHGYEMFRLNEGNTLIRHHVYALSGCLIEIANIYRDLLGSEWKMDYSK